MESAVVKFLCQIYVLLIAKWAYHDSMQIQTTQKNNKPASYKNQKATTMPTTIFIKK